VPPRQSLLPRPVTEAAERSASPGAVTAGLSRLIEASAALADRLEANASLLEALVAVMGARRIAARDLVGMDPLEEVGAGLARMADDVFASVWRLAGVDGVAVIAMGKYGGKELNYASDVDVLFVGSSSGEVASALDVARRCFRVDADLRPEGRDGDLVRSLDAYESYWQRWAKTWEFQALLKARAAAGDGRLGARFEVAATDALWSRPFGADEVREVRLMKARAEGEMVRRGLFYRELKRGRGGIRDVEFAVQLLQLVHGHADPSLRSPTTLIALAELASAGYVDR